MPLHNLSLSHGLGNNFFFPHQSQIVKVLFCFVFVLFSPPLEYHSQSVVPMIMMILLCSVMPMIMMILLCSYILCSKD